MAQQQSPSPSESWRRIDAWLAVHAPADLGRLNPPVAPADIARAETLLGTALPAELAESLSCHDGANTWSTLLPEQSPLPLDALVDRRRLCAEIAAENDGLTVRPWEDEPWWHPLWIPGAEGPDGGVQVIDRRPGPDRGRLGWAGHGGGGDFTDAPPGLAAFLHEVADALDHGGAVGGLHPYLTPTGDLWWDAPDTDTLDGTPLRPAPHRS
ncbi:SMI1/KNR4 family protein [Streptomyces sp. NPDC097619]|uniref:SMI1/KNR4 family protein n=1 Tax=Streptomyces sp. NPDC097619 TaxID=3157228 RepID=UPI003328347C